MMFETIFRLLPDWVFPVILGAALWFGANYFFLTGVIAERSVLASCDRANRAFCMCVSDHMLSKAGLPLSLWTTTLGLYDATRSPDVRAARAEGIEACQ